MASYNIQNIAEIVDGKLFSSNPQKEITELILDSRKVVIPEASLFFAIKGERHDGHDYIADLFQKGVRNFLVSDFKEHYKHLEANFIVVKDVLEALQQLSVYHRSNFKIPVIGITGSNGKTIVKEWLYQLLRNDKNIVRSPKSYNSQVGVPLSVWQMSETNDLAIFEAGISKAGEMEKLERIISPTIGLITNIGEAHSENFINLEQKLKEKLKLFNNSNVLIYCKDYELIDSNIPSSLKTFSWSIEKKADLVVRHISKKTDYTIIDAEFENKAISIQIPFIDKASIENGLHCWAVMLFLGYENSVIAERIKQLSPVAMRLEMKTGVNNCLVINDSYNSDMISLAIALDFMNQQSQQQKKTLILSDILQSGKSEEELYKEVATMVKQKNVNRFIGIGSAISKFKDLFEISDKSFFEDTQGFLSSFQQDLFKDEVILIKGARNFGFERITKLLQQKAHKTIFEINLNAIVHNLNYYKSKLNAGVEIMVMVKASSYGSGSYEIANILQYNRANYLAVAYADEGADLRKAGIILPIMVMNPEEAAFDLIIDHNLEPEIYSLRLLKQFSEAVKKRYKNNYPFHIKLDTGMHRLGMEENDIDELVAEIKKENNLHIKTVFSHLAASGENVFDSFTKEQVQKFDKIFKKIQSEFDYKIKRHILNSAGITRFPNAQYEMVRLGIGLYGIGADNEEQKLLQNVGTLKTTISQVKKVSPGESVGYSRKAIAEKAMKIATIAIGYADGFDRRLSNGNGKVYLNGKYAPVVGNVCMDMCMIDITEIEAVEGDEVLVFGKELPVEEVANAMKTISYEVFTGISCVKRVYFHE